MTKEEWKEFLIFLKKKHAFKKFKDNFLSKKGQNFRKDNHTPVGLSKYISVVSACLALDYAFQFDGTPQGFHYWRNISNEWEGITDTEDENWDEL